MGDHTLQLRGNRRKGKRTSRKELSQQFPTNEKRKTGIVEEEQYLTIGEDGRPYIAVRIKLRNKLENAGISEDVEQREVKTTVSPGIEDEDIRVGEGVTVIEEEDEETESLIREYQRSTIPNPDNLRLVEFYRGEEWRKDE